MTVSCHTIYIEAENNKKRKEEEARVSYPYLKSHQRFYLIFTNTNSVRISILVAQQQK